jgi:hypothetical protein
MSENWLAILSIILWIVVPFVVFLARHWIIARVTQNVKHHFDRQIEELRTDLRKSEEQYKSELRSREAELTALHNAVLAGQAGRQSLLDKRRFEAVEKVWTAVNDLGQLKFLSQTMAILNYKAVANVATDPRMQKILSIIGGTAPTDYQKLKNVARDEQPFLTELAWAYFKAYTSILHMNFTRYMLLKDVVAARDHDPERYFSTENLRKILKATLPHQSKFVDENDPGAYHYLLDEIYLLAELRKILKGEEADQAATARAKEIMYAIKQDEEASTSDLLSFQQNLRG